MPLENRQNWILNLNEGKIIIGTVEFSSKTLFIFDFNLERLGFKGRGFGRRCYEALEQEAKFKGVREIYGELMKENYDSKGFWEHMGFIIIQKKTPEWWDIMEKLKNLFHEDFDSDFIYKPL